jgi:uncharacterized protein (DUF1800 family)
MSRAATRCCLVAGLLVAWAGAGPRAADAWPQAAAADAAFLDALTWGATPSAFARLTAEGRARWLNAQLHPPAESRLPPAAQAQVDALTPPGSLFERAQALDAQAKAFKDIQDPDAKKAAQQAFQAALNMAARNAASVWVLRALYSPDQLRERLTWFWFNRFNVHQGKSTLRAAVGDYLDTAIRPHVLGRFRDLLMASLRHPAMLRYLDNDANAAGRPNENYAREIMELHTMGVGSGYTQGDVEALARILSGVGIDMKPETPKLRPEHAADFRRDGLFAFNPNRHDYGDKVFLGTRIQGRGWPEIEEAVDLIARHPATATNVSRALATYFLVQPPDDALVGRLAAAFSRSDGDIAAVMEALVREPAITA